MKAKTLIAILIVAIVACSLVVESGRCNCLAKHDSDYTQSIACKNADMCMAWTGLCEFGSVDSLTGPCA